MILNERENVVRPIYVRYLILFEVFVHRPTSYRPRKEWRMRVILERPLQLIPPKAHKPLGPSLEHASQANRPSRSSNILYPQHQIHNQFLLAALKKFPQSLSHVSMESARRRSATFGLDELGPTTPHKLYPTHSIFASLGGI